MTRLYNSNKKQTELEPSVIHPTDLIERCRKQQRGAQLALYRKYADGMFTVALRMVGNEADAQDMTQEAFIKAFRKIDQFRGEVSFGAWLKRIVVNRCLDFLKARKHHFVTLEEERMCIPDAEDSWETEYPVSPEEVKKAITELPEKYRYVVQLYLVEGYDHSEISDFLDITQTTCRSRLMRGKARLLEHLRNKIHVTGSEKNV